MRRLLGCLLILAGLATNDMSAWADTTSLSGATEITSLPYTINAPGVYFLNQNFNLNTVSGNGITVTTDGVTIDLNGHTISNLAGSTVTGAGVSCGGFPRLTVRNGTIRGFAYGVSVFSPDEDYPSYGNLVENVRVLNCTFMGVSMEASGSIVRRCQISKTGGSTSSTFYGASGIVVAFNNNSVQDCDISTVTSAGNAPAYGIVAYGGDSLVVNNRVSGATYGVHFNPYTPGKYRDNLCAASVTTPYTGGTDAGNN